MKSTIILLATLAGIGIAAEASAGDAQNLSCITETTDSGATVRDCGVEPPIVVYKKVEKVEVRHMPSSRIAPGGRGGDGDRGGSGGQGGNNGGQGDPNN